MTRITVRLFLVLATLLAQLPCGVAVRAAPPAEPDRPAARAEGRKCPCCKRAKAEPAAESPAPAPKPTPAGPSCPPDCPCAFCSPGYAPVGEAADPPRFVEPAADFLPEPLPADVPAGHRPSLDRPPRTAG